MVHFGNYSRLLYSANFILLFQFDVSKLQNLFLITKQFNKKVYKIIYFFSWLKRTLFHLNNTKIR